MPSKKHKKIPKNLVAGKQHSLPAKTISGAVKTKPSVTKHPASNIPPPTLPPAVQNHKRFRYFLFGTLVTLVVFVLPLYGYFFFQQLPKPKLLDYTSQNTSTKILDQKGRLLYEIYTDRQYNQVSLDKIPVNVINATLAIEDAKFYEHSGFRVLSMLRAAKETLLDNNLQGGSTITQQLVKNVLLSAERTYTRKLKELALAILVERTYSKDQILEFYLNNISYGGTAYGIQSAAQSYFNKNVWELSLGEASMLAGLPSAPSVYSPFQNDVSSARDRQKQVLARMVVLNFITTDQAQEAYNQDLVFASQQEFIRAPHFVLYVRSELYKRFGKRFVDLGGLTVTTTLDLDIQDKVQNFVTSEVVDKGKYFGFSNAGALVLDTKTNGILAYVGSYDYFNSQEGNFDVVTALRQPGSSIKPLTYALAFEKGFTPATLIDDAPITFQTITEKYTPKNYDGKYHGKVTLRTALANSFNIPAVKVLNTIGVDSLLEFGQKLNFANWKKDNNYGLSLTLGGKEVRLLDLTTAYAMFGRGGSYKPPVFIKTITDARGYTVNGASGEFQSSQVVSSETAYLISHILADNIARAWAFTSRSQLFIPGKTVAVKTGTTNEIRDNLTIGYTPTYTVGVWVGNNNNTPMNSTLASGLSGAAPIWNRIMTELLQNRADEEFTVPQGIITKIYPECGNLKEVFNKKFPIPSSICVSAQKTKEVDKKNDN